MMIEPLAGRILEGIVTTVNDDGSPNISPMGPMVGPNADGLLLRPYQTSQTFQNLVRTRHGVFHVIDDVELLAHAAVNSIDMLPPLQPAEAFDGFVLSDACRWYEFRVLSIDDAQPRAELVTEIITHRRGRDFFGWNRAMHAVVEAAILATRIKHLPVDELRSQMDRLASAVEKTGAPPERRAYEFLRNYIEASWTASR